METNPKSFQAIFSLLKDYTDTSNQQPNYRIGFELSRDFTATFTVRVNPPPPIDATKNTPPVIKQVMKFEHLTIEIDRSLSSQEIVKHIDESLRSVVNKMMNL